MLILPSFARRLCLLAAFVAAVSLNADPLSKHLDVDFFRDVSSRDLHGLATRSDGRIVAGPALTELTGDSPASLLWCLEPGASGHWFIGTGPEGPDLRGESRSGQELLHEP